MAVSRRWPYLANFLIKYAPQSADVATANGGGAEVLINEEISDVTVGTLTFNGEYKGSLPTLGCPGCEGETRVYVD